MYLTATLPAPGGGAPLSFASWRSSRFPVPMVLTPSRGVGAAASFGQNLTQGILGGTAAGVATGRSTGSKIAGGAAAGLAVVAPFTGPAAPFLLAAAAIMGPVASLFKGCGEKCNQATFCADTAEKAGDQLRRAYWGQPVRYRSSQRQAVAYMQQIIDWLTQCLSNPDLGDVGRKYFDQRLVRGAPAPWCYTADKTGCDYFSAFLDPIANDPGVVDDPPASPDQVATAILSGDVGGVDFSSLLLPAALIAAGVFLL